MSLRRRLWFSRTFLIVVGGIFTLLFLFYGWGFQTLLSWKLRQEAKSLRVLNCRPQLLPEIQPNPASGTRLSDAGFTFEAPWDDIDLQKTKYVGKIAIFAFRSGRIIEFLPPGPKDGDLFGTVEKSFGDEKGTLRQVFGPEVVKSNYVFHKTMLELTPAQMKPWMSRREAVRISMLLLIKAVSSVGGETGIFAIETGSWKGFQFDDPTKDAKKITLELYDSEDRHAEIMFFRGPKEPAGITEADIIRVVRTLAQAGSTMADAGNGQKIARAAN